MPYEVHSIPFPKALYECHKQRFSGLLTIDQPSLTQDICWENGNILYVASSLSSQHFGEQLYKKGQLSKLQLEQITQLPKDTLLAQHLVDLGFVEKNVLESLLQEHTIQLLYNLFNYKEGQYKFGGHFSKLKMVQISVPIVDSILQSMRNVVHIELIKQWVGSLDNHVVLMTDPFTFLSSETLLPHEAYIMSRLDISMSLNELFVMLSGVSEEQILRVICTLKIFGIVEIPNSEFFDFQITKLSVPRSYEQTNNLNQQSISDLKINQVSVVNRPQSTEKTTLESELSAFSLFDGLSAPECYLKCVEYLGKNDIEKAYAAIKHSVELKPQNPDYHAQLARVLILQKGHNKDAEQEFLKAIELDPDSPDIPDLLVELADLYKKFGLTKQVEETLMQALTKDPNHAASLNRLKEYHSQQHHGHSSHQTISSFLEKLFHLHSQK